MTKDQTEDAQFDEIEAAREADGMTLMAAPTEHIPEVRALLAHGRAGSAQSPFPEDHGSSGQGTGSGSSICLPSWFAGRPRGSRIGTDFRPPQDPEAPLC